MFLTTTNARLCALLSLAMLAGGCSSSDEPQGKGPPAPESLPPSLATVDPVSKPTPRPKAPKYVPPYPNREHLFHPPKRSNTLARRGTGPGDEGVELLGFVAVDEPKAVLSIEGVVMSLAAGGQKYGIEVISVEPPKAVLQRGRNRWTASLD